MTLSPQRHLAERLALTLVASIALHAVLLGSLRLWRIAPPLQTLVASQAGEHDGPLQVHMVANDARALPSLAPVSQPQSERRPEVASSRAASAATRQHPDSASVPAVAQPSIAGPTQSGTSHPTPSFRGPHDVDVRAYPLNRPPIDDFQSRSYVADQIVRLRVYVDSSGHVDHVEDLPETNADADFVDHMKASIAATQFAPATHAGASVDSYFDVDLSITSAQPPLQEVKP